MGNVWIVSIQDCEDSWPERAFDTEAEAERWAEEYNAMGSSRAAGVQQLQVGRHSPYDAPQWVGEWSSSGAYGQPIYVGKPLNLTKPQEFRYIEQEWRQETSAPPLAEVRRLDDDVLNPRVEVHGTDREAVTRLPDETVNALKASWGGQGWWAHLVLAYADKYHPEIAAKARASL